ncbi:MAG: GDP-fucose synthetase [Candidatus Levybacteria bacterium RBG_16_35_11]|nr:MAG: GDP-fucose synthetase [Candidatus Levybacteria bacterium RBG_16_35_11]
MSLKTKKILLTGKSGFLGGHVYEGLLKRGILKKDIFTPSSKEFNLKEWKNCLKATKNQNIVIHLAAKIGGIGFNKEKPAELFYDNALMGIQLMEAARLNGVEKVVTIGTVCAYPKNAPIPFKETSLWDGYPEEVTAPYGMAKKMLLVQGKAYFDQYKFKSIFLLPVNLYGPGDHFESKHSHVMPALIKRIVDARLDNAKEIIVWGTGKATREFLYVKDAARGIILATERYEKLDPVNLGSGVETSIKKLVETISKIAGYKGRIIWDKTKPDGVIRRKLNVSKAEREFGFKAKTDLKTGIKETIDWYLKNKK